MRRNAFFLAVVIVATTAQLRALGPITQQWVQRFHAPGTSNNVPNGLAVDKHGNVFVTGYEINSNGNTYYSHINYVTLKYSSSGAPLWTNYVAGSTNPMILTYGACAIALDRAGNVFVTGNTTVAYSNDGVPLWTNGFAGDEAQSISVNPSSGAVYVSGFSTSNSLQYVTIKYSNPGAPLWTNSFSASQSAALAEKVFLALGNDGTAFVAGVAAPGNSWEEYATVAYSSHGTPLWTNYYNGPARLADIPEGLAVDKLDNVFITGSSELDVFNDFAATTIAYSAAGTTLWTNTLSGFPTSIAVNDRGDVFVGYVGFTTIAYSGSGVPLWTNFYTANANDNWVYAMAANFNRVFVTGATGSPRDIATVGYSSSGVPVSTNLYNGPANGQDIPQAITVGPGGDVYVTGYSAGTNNGYDIATIKYSPTRYGAH